METFTVKISYSPLINCFPMRFRWVTFVGYPTVLWEDLVQIQHKIIPVCFCQDGCCGNAQESSVSFDNAAMGDAGIGVEAVSVGKDQLWFYC